MLFTIIYWLHMIMCKLLISKYWCFCYLLTAYYFFLDAEHLFPGCSLLHAGQLLTSQQLTKIDFYFFLAGNGCSLGQSWVARHVVTIPRPQGPQQGLGRHVVNIPRAINIISDVAYLYCIIYTNLMGLKGRGREGWPEIVKYEIKLPFLTLTLSKVPKPFKLLKFSILSNLLKLLNCFKHLKLLNRAANQQQDLEDLSQTFWHEQDFESNSSTFWIFGLILDKFFSNFGQFFTAFKSRIWINESGAQQAENYLQV